MRQSSLFFATALPLAALVVGCGDSGDTDATSAAGNTSGGTEATCGDVEAGASCSNAVFDEIQTCMGGPRDGEVVRGPFAADGGSCTDEMDAMRTIEFTPPAPAGDKTAWMDSLQKIVVKRSGAECGSISFAESPWQRDATAASGTFSIHATGALFDVAWTCPNGDTGELTSSSKGCSAKLPTAEGTSGGTASAQYIWGPVQWFFCTAP